jgi:hypothetical protein
MLSKTFKRFDYGFAGNIEKYKSEEPPIIDYSQIKIPISMHIAIDD